MRSRIDYTLGWVCALPLEMAAAIAMLDETHPDLAYPPTDTNAYALGSIAGHDIVIACLPAGVYGTVSAATVVSHMITTFPQIQFGLMVGIGGGVPYEGRDIRLGDVVVSRPTGSRSGVLLLTHISLLEAEMMDHDEGFISPLVQGTLEKHPHLRKRFSCSGPNTDILFPAGYPHITGPGCNSSCPRTSAEPRVFYGTIASGNQVMKDSETRDRLTREFDIMCFEMEATGLMNQLPCLVIRGICDYCDSHKNKGWQGYAALTAAAYTRLLLSRLKPRTLRQLEASGEMTPEKKPCLQALFLTDPEDDKNALKRRKGERAPKTCSWILDTIELQEWLGIYNSTADHGLEFIKGDFRSNLLWLHGNPGTGKSTMAITMAEEPPKQPYFDSSKTLAYFFCDSSAADRRTAVSVLRGLLYQLIKSRPEWIEYLFIKYQDRKEDLFTSFDALWSVLMSIGEDAASGDKFCIIEAIDECDSESQDILLAQINQSFLHRDEDRDLRLHVLVTSRPYPEIGRHLNQFSHKDLSHYPRLAGDLRLLIESKVDELREQNRYSEKVAAEVSRILEDKAEGTFLWVGIACTELASTRSRDAVKILQDLPRGLHSLYRNLLDTALTHNAKDNQTILRMMSVVAISQRPLSVAELSVACNLYPDEDEESRLNFTHEDIEMCRLMVIVQDGIVRFLPKSVRDFLLRREAENTHLIDDMKAHAMLAYRCLDTGLDNYQRLSGGEIGLFDVEFLEYAASYWGLHAHRAKSEFHILEQHERFFRAKSSERNSWVMAFDYSLHSPGEAERFTVFHMAGIHGIVSLANFAFDEMQRTLLLGQWRKAQVYDDTKFTDSFDQTPLQVAAISGHGELMDVLLKRKVDKMQIRPQVVISAASNEEHGEHLMRLLLVHDSGGIQGNEAVFKATADNKTHGGAIFSMLLDRDPNVWVSQSFKKPIIVRKASQGPRSFRIAEIMKPPAPIGRPVITEQVIKAATKFIGLLGDQLELNARIVEDMCANLETSAVRLLLRQNRISLTVGLLGAAWRNHSRECDCGRMTGQEILSQICDYAGPEVIERLVNQQEKPLWLTSGIASGVAYFNDTKEDVIKLLINRCNNSNSRHPALQICLMFDAGIVCLLLDKAITGDRVSPKDVMASVLLHPHTLKLSDEMIYMTCQNFDADVIRLKMDLALSVNANRHRNKVMTAILQRLIAGYIAQDVIAMICERFDSVVVKLLLEKQNGLEEYGRDVIISILGQPGHPPIKPELIAMLCGLFDAGVLDQLENVAISKAVVHAASKNFMYGESIMALLLRRTGRRFIEPDAIAAVYELFGGNMEIIAPLQSHVGPLFWIQDGQDLSELLGYNPQDLAFAYKHYDARHAADAIMFAASNVVDARNMIQLRDSMFEAAAANEHHGFDAMEVLMDWVGNSVTISERVFITAMIVSRCWRQDFLTSGILKAAFENHGNRMEIITTLLNCYPGKAVHITQDLVRLVKVQIHPEAVATVCQLFKRSVVSLLLEACGDRLAITDEMFEAAATNCLHGKEVLSFLATNQKPTRRAIEKALEAAGSLRDNPDSIAEDVVLTLLLETFGDQVPITQRVLIAAASHRQFEGRIPITDAIIQAAATNQYHGKRILDELQRYQQGTCLNTREPGCPR
ncbi:hypothetical protein BJY00DRAFT_323062 [Aspergillus carlsbadensis]|nr:hypothetical protein BJY00DRAFT_323062 [Aspergillus carlsbadensis]